MHFEERAVPIREKAGQVFVPDYNGRRDPNGAKEPGEMMLFPNQGIQGHIRATQDPNDNSKDVAVLQSDINLLENRDVTIYVFGRVCYHDVFNRPHWLRFCSLYMPKEKAYFACSVYNEVDNGKNGNEEKCGRNPN
jgi:hypothetical protein